MLAAINERIEALYDRDHAIGHAYFMSLDKVPDGQSRMEKLAELFHQRILPLLEEYFFEDWRKIQLVLADNQKASPSRFIVESEDHDDDLFRLFGNGHGLDSYATKHRYTVQESALRDPDAYLGIYATLAS
jgi:5-methylcytosine-specific restriction protein B